jgi:hypothetical protein
MADRIQARAIRRCGELLKQVAPAKNQHDAQSRAHVGAGTSKPDLFASRASATASTISTAAPPSRSQAARDAGLSERQKVTALRVASVPEESFTAQVESDRPPTVTKLAEQGKKQLIDLGGREQPVPQR